MDVNGVGAGGCMGKRRGPWGTPILNDRGGKKETEKKRLAEKQRRKTKCSHGSSRHYLH